MKIVGLTGGIGSGKSTVAAMFKELGVPVYNSDERAKYLMNTSKKIKKQLIELLGKKAYDDNKLNRPYIAEKVFNDTSLLSQLNSIVHPIVKENFNSWSKKQDTPYIIQETALLFENKSQELYDIIILITAPKVTRINRVLSRDKTTIEQVEARMNNQLDDTLKIQLANYIIENVDLENTHSKVIEVHKAILAES
ncbi:dephospho-CoA kinase [Maribacter hydrothermalis]|uniref:Dephospho-CoA kinase n=1 Tax=Maribacter hydrothermalis TaxID=1836467 RepID=A0A1B7Z7Z2_9FLAO|nr:dephospho-CoA kinase [Maribacter hydrothermalis]APQ19158.1 dephospho-CoA kinase [Maribacter hydrothermalis]OBR38831.1 dephospho-CoA kinase [Maribacter hydrothermalis]